MATPKIVPRAAGEGSLGDAAYGWGSAFVTNTTTSSATEGGKLTLSANDGAVMASGHRLGVIEFKGAEDTSNTLTTGARIEVVTDAIWSASENGASLNFYTTDGNASESQVLGMNSNKQATFSGNTIAANVTSLDAMECGATGFLAKDSTTSSATEGGNLVLASDDGAVMGSGHRLGVIEFKGAEDTGNTLTVGARIESITKAAWDASNNDAKLSFYTSYDNAQQSEKVDIGGKTAMSVYNDYDTITFENQLADNEGGGDILRYGSGQAGAIGTLHFLHTDGSWDVCDANAVATGGSQLLGIPMGTDPGVHGMLLKGYYKVASGSVDGTAAIGAPVYVADDSTGEFDFTAPNGSGDYVRIVGYCIDIDSSDILLYFNPDNTFVEIT